MEEKCMYCQAEDERRLELMTKVAKLQVSTLHFYREQSYPGRCVLVHGEHVQKLTDLTPEAYAVFFADVARAAQALTELYHPDKINYLVLGDLCPHLHIHLVPKFEGRTDWGGIFQMMPEPRRYLEEAQEQVEIQRIREKLEEMANGF